MTASVDEVKETLLSVLAVAGLPLRSRAGTYVEDAYFTPTNSDRYRDLVELDFTSQVSAGVGRHQTPLG